ncbi:MAG: hypothetical protein A2475_01195 [Ignavibacteria bacterium RIFOXYC2_FULL_35_21]|nr:MAG: hypothetical protein A2220_01850 [Ignavibacteria bacterium RIFOXYA2_FULL_35_10]OGV21261.1 MAG: hypothetical protein A2475_01195 [Ignavibacteria bacterium RIFOXYC2_FULL_35_21]
MAERKIILILSGEICSGKTTLAINLLNKYHFNVLKTKEGISHYIKSDKKHKETELSREFLQNYGETLDKKTNGKWLLKYFQEIYGVDFSIKNYFLVDSARILKQIEHFRSAYSYLVYHIHLIAKPDSLTERYHRRNENKILGIDVSKKIYSIIKSNETEKKVIDLAKDADLVIDTDRCSTEDVLIRVASFLKLLPNIDNQSVDVLIGGQFGSEGKGQVAAHIAPEYDCLIRVGGPNAGHSVYELPNNHIFHLIPSGSFRNQTAKLLIGAGAVLSLEKIVEEISNFSLEDSNRLVIDENATIIKQKDIKYEQKIKEHIGSTGQGVGSATANNILARLMGNDKHKAKHYQKELGHYLGSVTGELEKCYSLNSKILLEGTQGTALSLYHGIYPHVTSRDTTVSGCLSEAGISPKRVRKIIMVIRTYPIRVGGTSGKFISNEITWKEIATRSGKKLKDLINNEKTSTTKRDRRVAEFSWELFRKACEINSPTDIALTFTDYISNDNEKARRYDQLTAETRQLIEEIERCSGIKVSLIGTCFDYRAIIDRRNWR